MDMEGSWNLNGARFKISGVATLRQKPDDKCSKNQVKIAYREEEICRKIPVSKVQPKMDRTRGYFKRKCNSQKWKNYC